MRHSAIRPATVVLCLLGLVAGDLHGATYHVRTDGHDTNCDGTGDAPDGPGAPDCAFATAQACADAVSGAGDRCLFGAGTYTACPANLVPYFNRTRTAIVNLSDRAGAPGDPIVFRGAGDGAVVFEATDLGAGDYCDYGFILDDSAYVEIGGTGANEGFTFRGDFDHNNRERNEDSGTIHLTGDEQGVAVAAGSSHVRILGNTFEGTTDPELFDHTGGEIFLRDGSREGVEIAFNHITWRVLRSAISTNDPQGDCCADEGECPGDEDLRIHHNTMIWDPETPYRASAFLTRGIHGLEFYNNYIRFLAATPVGETMQTILLRDGRNARIYNNYIEAYGVAGSYFVYFQNGCQPTSTNDVVSEGHRVYNNTFYGQATAAIRLQDTEDTEIRNNIYYGFQPNAIVNGYAVRDLQAGSTGSFGHESFYNVRDPWEFGNPTCADQLGAANCDADATNLYTDPGLNLAGDRPAPFFSLQPGSPAVDRGLIGADTPLIDYDGDARDGLPDIGADEQACGEGYVKIDGGLACRKKPIERFPFREFPRHRPPGPPRR